MSNPFKLLLIDNDPVFRMGLRAWLQQFSDLEAIAEAETDIDALDILTKQSAPDKIDLAILDLGLAGSLELCQAIAKQFPHLPILLLTSPQPVAVVSAALQTGVAGYCLKGTPATELVNTIRTCASGGKYLQDMRSRDRSLVVSTEDAAGELETVSILAVLQHNLRISGLRQIERALRGVKMHLDDAGTSMWDDIERIVLEGRQRELRAARWLVSHLLKSTKISMNANSGITSGSTPKSSDYTQTAYESTASTASPDSEAQLVRARLLQAEIFDRTVAKLQSGLSNLTNIPLEIDILREEQKQELLLVVLRHLEDQLVELRLSQVQPQELSQQEAKLLQDLWQATTISFFGKYYSVDVGRDRPPVVDVLLGDAAIVQAEILAEIPQVSELISYLIFQTDLVIDNATYAAGTIEAALRAESLLDNLAIGIANAVMQPLLNHFADVEAIKQKFYDYRLIATREIERFRNNLSWKYRLRKYFQVPQAIFESRFDLFVLASPGIKQQSIYAPRRQELTELGGIQLAVTLVLEVQDAIAPRLRSAVSFIGSGIVYVLTNIVGKGIGLIGRGILQGIGSAWQDSRPRKKS
jgi:DNA-binding NarL/FixJ family response regulator